MSSNNTVPIGGVQAPVAYSAVERETDRLWVDGKPIYEKVIDIIGGVPDSVTPGVDQTVKLEVFTTGATDPDASTVDVAGYSVSDRGLYITFTRATGAYAVVQDTTAADSGRVIHYYTKL